MKFFVDSGNLEEIRKLVPLGIVDGVTTNPSLLAKEPRDATDIIKDICRLVQGPVSYEVVATDAKGMITEGRKLAAVDPHVVVKAPFTTAGVEATKALSSEGIKVNVTLCFSPAQALIAAKVGAAYISPFIGRLDDIATDGLELVRQIVEIYRHYSFRTEVLVASVRGPMHIVQAARMGADVCTCPPAVLEACFKHPLTDIGLEKFLKDWNKAQENQKLEVKSQK
jgi:transaldolase